MKPMSFTLEHQEQLDEICRRYHVSTLYVFGSVVKGTFQPQKSDMDFLVSFQNHREMNAFDQYFGLKEELAKLFSCDVDLLTEVGLKNPYFIEELKETQVKVYAA